MDSSLAPWGMAPEVFQDTLEPPGDQLQHTHMQLTAVRYEFVAPDANVYDLPIDMNTLVNFDNETGEFLGGVKQQFGLFTYLMKPADWSGQVYPNQRPWHKAGKGKKPGRGLFALQSRSPGDQQGLVGSSGAEHGV